MSSEEATRRNLLAVKAHSEKTREMVREVDKKLKQIEVLRQEVGAMKKQIETLFRRR